MLSFCSISFRGALSSFFWENVIFTYLMELMSFLFCWKVVIFQDNISNIFQCFFFSDSYSNRCFMSNSNLSEKISLFLINLVHFRASNRFRSYLVCGILPSLNRFSLKINSLFIQISVVGMTATKSSYYLYFS